MNFGFNEVYFLNIVDVINSMRNVMLINGKKIKY